MMVVSNKYCLDANVLIQAWQKYYNPKFCSDYWNVLNELGEKGKIIIAELVYDEIVKTDDALSTWVKECKIPVKEITGSVTKCLQKIYSSNPLHKKLVDNIKSRSIADPWIIAHAIDENAIVVTKEEKVTALNSQKTKIPNVSENMGIECINDFQLVDQLGVRFKCSLL